MSRQGRERGASTWKHPFRGIAVAIPAAVPPQQSASKSQTLVDDRHALTAADAHGL